MGTARDGGFGRLTDYRNSDSIRLPHFLVSGEA
jgi:hypothetical protein